MKHSVALQPTPSGGNPETTEAIAVQACPGQLAKAAAHSDDHAALLEFQSTDGTADLAAADDPTQLRWGQDDVLWGDDGTVTVLLSDSKGKPYWLELGQERAAALRENLASPGQDEPTERQQVIDQHFDV